MKNRNQLFAGIALLIAFIAWTILIQTVDVQAVGVNGTEIGFAAVNTWFHKLTGVHLTVCSAVFILTRQPYAGIICFTVLIVKGCLCLLGKSRFVG